MAETVAQLVQRQRDIEAFLRYFAAHEGVRLPHDLPLLEYCAGSLGMPQKTLLALLGLDR